MDGRNALPPGFKNANTAICQPDHKKGPQDRAIGPPAVGGGVSYAFTRYGIPLELTNMIDDAIDLTGMAPGAAILCILSSGEGWVLTHLPCG